MPDHLGDDMRKVRTEDKEEEIKSEFWTFCGFILWQRSEESLNDRFPTQSLSVQVSTRAILSC